MKPLTLTVHKQQGPSAPNPYGTTIRYTAELSTPFPVEFSHTVYLEDEPNPRMEYESQVELLRQLIPQVTKLADMKSIIIAMLTSENPNYFKHKSTIADCLNAIDEAISIYDVSNYNG